MLSNGFPKMEVSKTKLAIHTKELMDNVNSMLLTLLLKLLKTDGLISLKETKVP